MTEENTTAQAEQRSAPNPALKRLGILVGDWNVSGPTIHGRVTFEWMKGGYFLVQRGDIIHDGHQITSIEVIGYEQKWGEDKPGKDCTSHVFDNEGHHFEYVWEVDDNTLTIWGGYVGSPAAYKGTFSEDHNTVTGAWEWPGGGYESAMTRVSDE